jgi:hypothetical protein
MKEVEWTDEEDDFIWDMWKNMKNDEEIMNAAMVVFKGKSRQDIKARRVHLVYHGSGRMRASDASDSEG